MGSKHRSATSGAVGPLGADHRQLDALARHSLDLKAHLLARRVASDHLLEQGERITQRDGLEIAVVHHTDQITRLETDAPPGSPLSAARP